MSDDRRPAAYDPGVTVRCAHCGVPYEVGHRDRTEFGVVFIGYHPVTETSAPDMGGLPPAAIYQDPYGRLVSDDGRSDW